MSKRLTKKWTKTTEQAFGASGRKGAIGEKFFAEIYTQRGYEVIVTESDRKMQLKGIDVILKKDDAYYSIDVKNNLKKDNSFCVEINSEGWLFNTKYLNVYVSHVNPETRTIATYKRDTMKDFIDNHFWDFRDDIISLHKDDPRLTFIKWQFV